MANTESHNLSKYKSIHFKLAVNKLELVYQQKKIKTEFTPIGKHFIFNANAYVIKADQSEWKWS